LQVADSLPHLLVAAEMRLLLEESEDASAGTLTKVASLDGVRGADLDTCRRAVHFLRTRLGTDRSGPFREVCVKRFPLATWEDMVFVGPLC
jgi:hypothetical protein